MRFVKTLIVVVAVSFVGAGFVALTPNATAAAHPPEHSGLSPQNCAELCAANNANNGAAQLPVAVTSHGDEQEYEAEPTPEPDAQFYARFMSYAEWQPTDPGQQRGADTARPPDIFKLTMNYRN